MEVPVDPLALGAFCALEVVTPSRVYSHYLMPGSVREVCFRDDQGRPARVDALLEFTDVERNRTYARTDAFGCARVCLDPRPWTFEGHPYPSSERVLRGMGRWSAWTLALPGIR